MEQIYFFSRFFYIFYVAAMGFRNNYLLFNFYYFLFFACFLFIYYLFIHLLLQLLLLLLFFIYLFIHSFIFIHIYTQNSSERSKTTRYLNLIKETNIRSKVCILDHLEFGEGVISFPSITRPHSGDEQISAQGKLRSERHKAFSSNILNRK